MVTSLNKQDRVAPEQVCLSGNWNIGIALGYLNSDLAPRDHIQSLYSLKLHFTELGKLITAAKFSNDSVARKKIATALISGVIQLKPFQDIYYVPPRDSGSDLNAFVALQIARAFKCNTPKPAFHWNLFPSFKKGMAFVDMQDLFNLQNEAFSEMRMPLAKTCLLVDDIYYTGSTLTLSAEYLKRALGYERVNTICIAKVQLEGDPE